MRFVPLCAGCDKLLLDLTQANVAVVGHRYDGMTPAGIHHGAKVSRLGGFAQVFCWKMRWEARKQRSLVQRRAYIPGLRRRRAATFEPYFQVRYQT
jgi:hypothetical protein